MNRSVYTVAAASCSGSESWLARAGPSTGTRKPWVINSSSWEEMRAEATWRT